MKIFLSILGWGGTAMLLLAYCLLSFKYIESNTVIYQSLNMVGALALSVNLFHKKAIAGFMLEFIWGGVALVSLFKILFAN